MKYLCFVILCCVLSTAFAQTEGTIVFEEKIDIHRRLPEDRQQFKDMIPQFRTTNFELVYNNNESLYHIRKDQGEEETAGGGPDGPQFRMRMARPERTVYKNLSENKLVDSREFMTKKFLIKGTTDAQQWKIADGQKQILNYMCMKAEYRDTSDTYIVWFTPQIPVSNGPAEYSGLPGMILQVDMNDGERVLTATEVIPGEIDAAMLSEPTKGKEVTQEEFREIVHEKMQEMGHGPGPQVHIIRQ